MAGGVLGCRPGQKAGDKSGEQQQLVCRRGEKGKRGKNTKTTKHQNPPLKQGVEDVKTNPQGEPRPT